MKLAAQHRAASFVLRTAESEQMTVRNRIAHQLMDPMPAGVREDSLLIGSAFLHQLSGEFSVVWNPMKSGLCASRSKQ
jgi:hypothetical protein